MSYDAPVRRTPRDAGARRVTERDLQALLFIARAQPVSTDLVRMFLQASTAVTRRRLRVLRDHGLVRVEVPAMAGENLYLLSERGLHTLTHHFGDRFEAHLRVLRRLPKQLEHHLGSARFIASLLGGPPQGHEVAEFMMERDIRRELGSVPAGALIPDAVVVMRCTHGTYAISVEVDTGTERAASQVARGKLALYGELRAAGQTVRGQTVWSVVLLCPSERRLQRLAQAMVDARLPPRTAYFALYNELTDENVQLSTSWRTLGPEAADPAVGRALIRESPMRTMARTRYYEVRQAGGG